MRTAFFTRLTLLLFGQAGFAMAQGTVPELSLPIVRGMPGDTVYSWIRLTADASYGADLTFAMASAYVEPTDPFIAEIGLTGNFQFDWIREGPTVHISLATPSPQDFSDEGLVRLGFVIPPDTPMGTDVPLTWIAGNGTTINEQAPTLNDGVVGTYSWGDATGDGAVTSYDAAVVLQHVVGVPTAVTQAGLVDVSANGSISAYDAALVLIKTVYPSFRFPIEEPIQKLVRAPTLASLEWGRRGDDWVLLSRAGPVRSLQVDLMVPDEARIASSAQMAARRSGDVLKVAVANPLRSRTELLVVTSDRPPQIIGGYVEEVPLILPSRAGISHGLRNWPNPFNPSTTIGFELPESGFAQLAVYDLAGKRVRILIDGEVRAGLHAEIWDGRTDNGGLAASGVYICRLETRTGQMVRRMILAR